MKKMLGILLVLFIGVLVAACNNEAIKQKMLKSL